MSSVLIWLSREGNVEGDSRRGGQERPFRPGQTRLVSSWLLGNQQGAWSNLLYSASCLLYLSLFLCLSHLLTFVHHTAFPICHYLLLGCLSSSLSLVSSVLHSWLTCFPQLCLYVWLYLSPSYPLLILSTSQCIPSGCVAVPPLYRSHWAVRTALYQGTG